MHEDDRDEIMRGSIPHTLQEGRHLTTVRELAGETIVLVASIDRPGELADVWRLTTSGGGVATFRYYFFCPEVLREIAAHFALSACNHGYWF